MQNSLVKLRTNAGECAQLSQQATDHQKRKLFERLASQLSMLAEEVERAIDARRPSVH